ncbi:MAG: radical SAM protein [Betaproteobacteria bacterium]
MSYRIDEIGAPLFIAWQVTRDCDLACLHCCTESAPGKRLPDELDRDEALRLAADIIRNKVPYVMLCGGEPLVSKHFFELAEALGSAGIRLKIETNGQRFDADVAARLARLPIRSIQVSVDGDSQQVYEHQRPGASLAKVHAACRAIRDGGMPLEITFAPTRLNIHEAPAVIARAVELGAFRFNTGKLMRIGTAARHWARLVPTADQYRTFLDVLARATRESRHEIELCYSPFAIEDGLAGAIKDPPATLLVLPNGKVKVAAALPFVCADLRRASLVEAWEAYRGAWRDESVLTEVRRAMADDSHHAKANTWRGIPVVHA